MPRREFIAKRVKVSKLFLVFFMLMMSLSNAYAGFFDEHAHGWHWYQQEEEKEKVEIEQAKKTKTISPLQAIKNIRKEIETKKAIALLEPTEENLAEYIKTQEYWTDRAEQFSVVWQQVIRKHPELNYSLKHPTSELAKRVEAKSLTLEKQQAVKAISKEYGLFYFYRGDCPYCQRFSPILKSFAKRFGLNIIAISLDGQPNEHFPLAKPNNGIGEKWNVTQVPAVFAVSPKTDSVLPISFGLQSEVDLEQKFLMTFHLIQGGLDAVPTTHHHHSH
jgi:conjugal transfer pilus assembly protein TraF